MLKVALALHVLVGILAVAQACSSSEFTCYNGDCEPLSYVCDGYPDCPDGSDEFGCVNLVGIAVGVSVAAFVIFVILPIIICVVVWCCVVGAAASSNSHQRRTVVTTAAPATSATVVTATSTHASTPYYPAPGGFSGPATQGAPPPYTPGYAQKPTGYTQQPTGYTQQPTGYAQQPTGYAQQPTGYAPQPGDHPGILM